MRRGIRLSLILPVFCAVELGETKLSLLIFKSSSYSVCLGNKKRKESISFIYIRVLFLIS